MSTKWVTNIFKGDEDRATKELYKRKIKKINKNRNLEEVTVYTGAHCVRWTPSYSGVKIIIKERRTNK